MRIFSIHKSKSKKQISEKTPKLAAQKFLEKRKVGTVIYLHEHPSGKIHGPYRKEYDKKIMKGGAWSFGSLSKSEFKVRIPLGYVTPRILYETDQYIIKQTRRDFGEPHIFFGPKKFKIPRDSNVYYEFVVFNTYRHQVSLNEKQFIGGMIKCYTINGRNIVSIQMSEIKPEILLGFYTQYIDICKIDFPPDTRQIDNIDSLYMTRLFFYLFYDILPIISKYILDTYSNKIVQNLTSNNKIENLTDNTVEPFILKNSIQNRFQHNPEIGYFMNILLFIKRINFDTLLDNVLRRFDITYGTDGQRAMKKRIKQQIKQLSNTSNKRFKYLTPQQQVDELRRRSIHAIQESTSHIQSSSLAHDMAMTGTNPTGVFDIIMGIIGFFCGGR
jgi:hypothetical protein